MKKKDLRIETIFYAAHPCPFGRIFLAAGAKGLKELCIRIDEDDFIDSAARRYGSVPVLKRGAFNEAFRALDRYFAGRPEKFGLALDPDGTSFQKSVWRAIKRIPWGSTRSYAWVAASADRPKGARAAGSACGKNPLPIIIPCHRVLKGDGGIGGYTGGLDIKKALLGIEGFSV